MVNKYAEIIPLRRLIRNLAVFDYQIPKELRKEIKKGQLVEISFQNSKFLGVVSNLKETTNIPMTKIKEIARIVQKKPVITAEQFKLVDWMSNYYFVAKSTILKSVVPNFPKNPLKSEPRLSSLSPLLKIPQKLVPWLTREVKKYSSSICQSASLVSAQKEILLAFYAVLLRNKTNQRVTLIIVPDHAELNSILSLLNSKEIALIHSALNTREYFQQWEKVWKNKAKVIIGTRLAVFLPFSRLDQIIVHLEEDENHKNADQNPRFHIREAAQQLVKNYRAKILFTSQTPSLEMFKKITEGQIEPIDSPPPSTAIINVVSMEEEIKKGNFSGISENLNLLITQTINQKKSVFLFLNRKGMATSYLCQDCHWIARCPECLLLFATYEKNYFFCQHCKKQEPLVLKCPQCQGSNLKSAGKGIQAVEKELSTLFPQTTVHRVDQGVPIKEHYTGIVIGTEFALRNLKLSNIGAIGIVSADNLLYLPDFRSEERTYQLINRVIHFTPTPAPTIIQTFTPENKCMQAVAKQDFKRFAKEELKMRAALHWPPVWHLVRLIYQQKEAKIAEKEVNQTYQVLTQALKSRAIELSEPFTAHIPRRRGKYQWQLVLKIQPNHPLELKKIIQLIPDDWIVDVDPLTLL